MNIQNKILIEVVSNGFIITENYRERHELMGQAYNEEIKVFNTKKQLNKYINENLNTKQNEK